MLENSLTPIQNTWLKVEIINDTSGNMLRVDHAQAGLCRSQRSLPE